MQKQVVLDPGEWQAIEKVLTVARTINGRAARGDYMLVSLSTSATLASDIVDLQRQVCAMDGLCGDPVCKRRAQHPADEHTDATEDSE